MSFMTQAVFSIGILDAVLIMAFGIVIAFAFLFAKKELIDNLMTRSFPALMTLIGASVAAALVLASMRWLLGMPM